MSDLDDLRARRQYVEAALAYTGGTHTYQDVEDMVVQGRLQVWPAPHAAVITEILEHPQQKTLHVFLAAGSMSEIAVMEPIVLEWAREQGCTQASMLGRKGWGRTFLTKVGWQPSLVLFTKLI